MHLYKVIKTGTNSLKKCQKIGISIVLEIETEFPMLPLMEGMIHFRFAYEILKKAGKSFRFHYKFVIIQKNIRKSIDKILLLCYTQ